MGNKNKLFHVDILLSVFLVAISIIVLLGSMNLKPPTYDPLGAAFFPRLLSIVLLLLSIPIFIQGLRKLLAERNEKKETTMFNRKKENDLPAENRDKERPLLSLLVAVVSCIYVFAFPFIGFRISSIILLVLLGIFIYRRERKGKVVSFSIILISVSIFLSFLIFYIFSNFLNVSF